MRRASSVTRVMRGAPGRSRRGRATLVVGVGGLPGAGKSEVAKYFSEQGAEVIDADRIGWELLEPGTVTYERVCKVFGSQVLDSSGRIDRRKLGEIVFRSKPARMRLNRIIHPRLLAELRRRAFARVRGRWPGSAVRVIDAALLFYWGWHRRVDLAIAVVAPRAIKLRRLMDQGLTRTQAGQRLGSQLPEAKLRAMADLVIVNNGSRGRLRDSCARAWKIIEALSQDERITPNALRHQTRAPGVGREACSVEPRSHKV